MSVDPFLPEFSATKLVTWKCHVDESTTGRYNMILGRDLLTTLGLDLKFYENVIHSGEVPYNGCSAPMVDVNNDHFNILTSKKLNRNNYLLKRT